MVVLAVFYFRPGEAGTSFPMDTTVDEIIIIETDLLIAGFHTLSDLKVTDDGRFFVAEKAGQIRIGKSDGTILPDPFLDLSDVVGSDGELGLSSITLHPQFVSNGRFFVNYTTADLETYIAGYNVSDGDLDLADPDSRQVILTLTQPSIVHNGAGMAFGPDGYLYIGLGDGGPGNDPSNNAQNGQVLLGSILRLDVDGEPPYEIPDDNPFKDSPSVKDEIWDKGFRNPWRFSFDRSNGDLFIGDVGQRGWEEVDYEPAGSGKKNYGWRCYEGPDTHISTGCGDSSMYTFPIYAMPNRAACAVIGGYVYRGDISLPIDGHYLFADYCSGSIWGLVKNVDTWEVSSLGKTPLGWVTTFAQGPNGELYVADFGNIYSIGAFSVLVVSRNYLPLVTMP
jgi:glucose/arabinose dehydrogenase